MKSLRALINILAALLLYSCSTQDNSKIIGIKIYDYNGDYEILASEWREMGINTAFLSETLASDTIFRKALRKRGIAVYIIFPVFQDPDLLSVDSSLFAITAKGLKAKEDWVQFVCPSRKSFRTAKVRELADIIRTLDPDGISIDFIRQFVYWEMIYPGRASATIDRACYCDSCLAEFSSSEGIEIPDSCETTASKAIWVDNNHEVRWTIFRCDLITTMARDLAEKARKVKPGIKINFHAVPWGEDDFEGANLRVAGQDLMELGKYVDFISPMCYSQMLKQDAAWINRIVDDMNNRASGKILPSIQVYPYYVDSPFTGEDFKQCVVEALKPPSRGIVFFSWPLFEKDSSRMEIVRSVLGRKGGL